MVESERASTKDWLPKVSHTIYYEDLDFKLERQSLFAQVTNRHR